MSDNPKDHGYIKFIFSGPVLGEFLIETSLPQNLPIEDCVDFMAQMLCYIHSGSLIEQNASAVMEACTKKGHHELGSRIIQRWHQYEEENKLQPPLDAPCVPPSSIFLNRFTQ